VALFLGAHIALALALLNLGPGAATAHAGLTVVAAAAACGLARRAEPGVAVAAYLAGCDVLWRMAEARVPWELAKYLLGLVAIIGLVRFVPRPRRLGLPLLFVALLVPGAWITVERLGFGSAFEPLSFNLAGLVALALVFALATNLWTTRGALVDVCWVALGPVLTVTVLAWSSTRGLSPEDFEAGASNLLASGGFGPNQVSTLIGFGALLVGFLIAWDRRAGLKTAAGLLLVWFVVEAGLTFSRGGLLNVSVGLLLAAPHLVLDRRRAVRFIGLVLAGVGVVTLIVIPTAQQLTGDRFAERFTSFTTTLRRDIAREDVRVFLEEPAFGVGVGEAVAARDLDEPLASHTEYTRLLSEHGVLGLLALATLAAMAVQAYRRQQSLLTRAWAIALIGWALASMIHTSTRTAAPSFAFGFAALVVAVRPEEQLRRGQNRGGRLSRRAATPSAKSGPLTISPSSRSDSATAVPTSPWRSA
jgi:hypothetical protein